MNFYVDLQRLHSIHLRLIDDLSIKRGAGLTYSNALAIFQCITDFPDKCSKNFLYVGAISEYEEMIKYLQTMFALETQKGFEQFDLCVENNAIVIKRTTQTRKVVKKWKVTWRNSPDNKQFRGNADTIVLIDANLSSTRYTLLKQLENA